MIKFVFNAWLFLLATHAFADDAMIVDTDGDKVPDWEDYCPETPTGKHVWTVAQVAKVNGNPRWVGCAGGGVEDVQEGFEPPSKKSLQARIERARRAEEDLRKPNIVDGLELLSKNLARSFEEMSKAAVKPKALIFAKAAERLKLHTDSTSVNGVVGTLCNNRLLIDLMLPIIEETSSDIFEKSAPKAKKLSTLLTASVGNSCELFQIDHMSWNVSTMLHLMQSGWSALGTVGFSEADLALVSAVKTKLGVALANIDSDLFKEYLEELLDALEDSQALVESFHESNLVLGVAVMIESLKERLKKLLLAGGQISPARELVLGDGVDVRLSFSLVNAAVIFGTGDKAEFIHKGEKFSFAAIKAGSFQMGSPSGGGDYDERQHRITISRDFLMQTTEVTRGQYKAVMGSYPEEESGNGCTPKVKQDDHPVSCVSWDDAQRFVQRLNTEVNGNVYRLPTEAEWEFATRCGTNGPYSKDGVQVNDASLKAANIAWFDGRTNPVGQLEANKCGLRDVHGNVWEWVEDAYQENYPNEEIDPKVPSGSSRVLRGGGWADLAQDCRSANRDHAGPGFRYNNVGFRLLRTNN